MKILPKNLETVSIRIDFFSKPAFKETFVGKLDSTELNKLKFYNRLLTDEEKQRIDIDNVAQNLSISIEEIVCKRVYIYTGITGNEINVETYIGDYFIFMCFEKIKNDNVSDIEKISNEVFGIVKTMENEINAQILSYRMNSHIQANYDYLKEEINSEYIKIYDDEEFTNARYADLFIIEEGKTEINLIRDVIKGISENTNYVLYDILISAIANRRMEGDILQETDFNKLIEGMAAVNTDKINRCYK